MTLLRIPRSWRAAHWVTLPDKKLAATQREYHSVVAIDAAAEVSPASAAQAITIYCGSALAGGLAGAPAAPGALAPAMTGAAAQKDDLPDGDGKTILLTRCQTATTGPR